MGNETAKEILESVPPSDSFLFLLLGVMIISGILAGLIHFFLTENQKSPLWKALFGNALLGIAGSLIVPLFLNIISNNLLAAAQKNPVNLFVLNGICLVFAFFLCRFKEILVIKRPQKTEEPKKENAIIIPIKTGYDLKTDQHNALKNEPDRIGMSAGELRIMRSIAEKKGARASLVDLLKDPALVKEKVNETLSSLMAKGIVEQRLSKDNRLLLYLTPKGDRMLGKALGKPHTHGG